MLIAFFGRFSIRCARRGSTDVVHPLSAKGIVLSAKGIVLSRLRARLKAGHLRFPVLYVVRRLSAALRWGRRAGLICKNNRRTTVEQP